MSEIIELQPNQTRQYIDAETTFWELLRVKKEHCEVRGRMFWRKQRNAEYLIRESAGGSQKSLGAKSSETEAIFCKFQQKKDDLTSRLDSLQDAVQLHQRMNKALRVGRVPTIVVKTLNALRDAGVHENFLTIGTHALYAYEAACGVRLTSNALATQDIDLLFDARTRLSFLSHIKKIDSSFIAILQKADPSFRVMGSKRETAVNNTGFEIDLIRRMNTGDDPHPMQITDFEGDLWPVRVKDGDRMFGQKKFSQMIVSESGHMSVMHTLDPRMFVAIKSQLAKAADRDVLKKSKDGLQAALVSRLIQSYMPQFHSPQDNQILDKAKMVKTKSISPSM